MILENKDGRLECMNKIYGIMIVTIAFVKILNVFIIMFHVWSFIF